MTDSEEAVTLADRIVVLCVGRDAIGRVIAVALPRPRERGCREFGEVREELLREFHLSEN
jgi:ABC-type nitrate/sulfonate/bicarbonate transport system ATPase subunit